MVVTMPRRFKGSYCSKPLEKCARAHRTPPKFWRGHSQKSLKTAYARGEGEEEDEADS